MQETRVPSLGREDPLEEAVATRSCSLAWEIPRTEEPGGLQSLRSQRIGQIHLMISNIKPFGKPESVCHWWPGKLSLREQEL